MIMHQDFPGWSGWNHEGPLGYPVFRQRVKPVTPQMWTGALISHSLLSIHPFCSVPRLPSLLCEHACSFSTLSSNPALWAHANFFGSVPPYPSSFHASVWAEVILKCSFTLFYIPHLPTLLSNSVWIFPAPFLAYFLILKNESRLMRSPCFLCVCESPL
jgi:hypothetical protein